MPVTDLHPNSPLSKANPGPTPHGMLDKISNSLHRRISPFPQERENTRQRHQRHLKKNGQRQWTIQGNLLWTREIWSPCWKGSLRFEGPQCDWAIPLHTQKTSDTPAKESSSPWPMSLPSGLKKGVSVGGRWGRQEHRQRGLPKSHLPSRATITPDNSGSEMTRRRVVTRVLPGSLHLKSWQEKSQGTETKAVDGQQVTSEIRDKSLWGEGPNKPT